MVKRAGFEHVRVRAVQPVFTAEEEGRMIARASLEDIKPRLLETQLATPDELDELTEQLKVFENQENMITSLPRIFQVTGERPGGGSVPPPASTSTTAAAAH
jgi:hypothetical protein